MNGTGSKFTCHRGETDKIQERPLTHSAVSTGSSGAVAINNGWGENPAGRNRTRHNRRQYPTPQQQMLHINT